jgi:hypothetical protein
LRHIPTFETESGYVPAVVHKPTSVTHLESVMLRWVI